ncbi:MAG: hypothetical protein ACYTG5_14320, partial [Planctomycetota bacterium]
MMLKPCKEIAKDEDPRLFRLRKRIIQESLEVNEDRGRAVREVKIGKEQTTPAIVITSGINPRSGNSGHQLRNSRESSRARQGSRTTWKLFPLPK